MRTLQKIHTASIAATLMTVVVASSCTIEGDSAVSNEETSAVTNKAAVEASTAGLRAAYIEAVQASAPANYRVERTTARLIAVNTAQQFSSTFTEAGVEVADDEDPEYARFVMELAAFGCENNVFDVAKVSPEASNTLENRVEYKRDNMVEWYVNGPLGLEQGFTLDAAPACRSAGGKEVALEIKLGGELEPMLTDDGVNFQDESGRVVMRYSDLYVRDAADKVLPSRLSLSGRRLSILVDDADAVYPITVDPLVGVLKQTLVAGDGQANALFGQRVVISGDTALVGAPGANKAYIFGRDGNNVWSQQKKLVSSDGLTGNFGYAVALQGNRALVGARSMSSAQGAVYAFEQGLDGNWNQIQKIVPPTGGSGYFGNSASMSGSTAIIGASLADKAHVYVFNTATGQWVLQQTLVGSGTAAGDQFGHAVAVDQNYAVVGAPFDDDKGTNTGSAYVFVRATGGTTWTQQKKLLPSNATADSRFGTEVTMAGNLVALTSVLDGTSLFLRNTTTNTWSQENNVPAFCTAFVGVTLGCKRNANDVVLFSRGGGTWPQLGETFYSPTMVSHVALDSVAAFGSQVLVGDKNATPQGVDSGAVYAVTLLRGNGDACTTATECASGFCADGVCCNTACGGSNDTDCQACAMAKGAGQDGTCAAIPGGTVCRSAAGVCDQAEVCNGTSTACPSDTKLTSGSVCRAAAGACDKADVCNGTSNTCPTDAKLAAGTVCRAAADVCDQAEACNGTSDTCPADAKVAAGTVCRGASNACDQAEVCNGNTNACPADALAPEGTVCRASAGECDVAELCDGSAAACPADAVVAQGTLCRSSAGACDVAESCDGTAAACPADTFVPAGTECRASADKCDVAESCTGSSAACPVDGVAPAGTVCRAAGGACDVPDTCNGATIDCPVNPSNEGKDCTGSTSSSSSSGGSGGAGGAGGAEGIGGAGAGLGGGDDYAQHSKLHRSGAGDDDNNNDNDANALHSESTADSFSRTVAGVSVDSSDSGKRIPSAASLLLGLVAALSARRRRAS
jgi:hypothetical protein